MARTSAFSALRRGIRLALDAERRGIPLHASLEHREQLAAAYAAHEVRRRDFVRGASAALASSYLLSGCATEDHASDLHVGVVGAGMAGLLCAYRLKQAGVRVTVFEGSTRAGGRMYTARSKLPGSAVIELGGELIDTGHATLRRVARELGVAIDEVTDYPKDVRADTYFVGGKRVLEAVLADAFRPLAARMQSDLKAADKSDDAFAKLDAQSIAEWLDAMPDLDPTLKKVLSVAYVGEYGRELDEQSVFNLLWLIDSRTPEPFRIFGDSDERSHIHLGSDTIPTLLAKKLDAELRYEQRLVRVGKLSDGRIRLTLDHGGKSSEQTFDKVVLAIPFTMLRSVEHSTGLFGDKQTIIDELGYGTNAKLIGKFASRVWLEKDMASGSSFSDGPVQCTWEASRKQPTPLGALTVFLGGKAGASVGDGAPDAQMRRLLPELDKIFPGTADAYQIESALRMHWPTQPWVLGSYACYLPGQAAWSGTEGEKIGNLHFCGEHTSEDFQGYMEGAAESGERVADEIFAELGLASLERKRLLTGQLRLG